MSIQIASKTNTDSTATTKVTGDEKVSNNLTVDQSTSETISALADIALRHKEVSQATSVAISPAGLTLLANENILGNTPSGYATMLRRLFNTTDPNAEPAVATRANTGTSDISFLNQADRQVLGKAYQYAIDNKIDLTKVDALAGDLGGYRFLQATGNNIETKQGTLWNTDGSPWYFKMTAEDSATATRILKSDEANQTSLDSGFIAYVLNPRGGGWTAATNRGHSVDFGFLEKVIGVTKPAGANSTALSSDQGIAANSSAGHTKSPSNPLFQNSLYWISHQDIPNLPPEGYEPPSDIKDSESKGENALDLSSVTIDLLSNDYINNLLDVMQVRAQKNFLHSIESSQKPLLTPHETKLDFSSLLREIFREKIKAAQ